MLAQSEIDALLSGAIDIDQQDGKERINLADMMTNQPSDRGRLPEDEKKIIQNYNFWSPARFSKEQMR
ncbi:MAG: hypothetical protein WCP19_10095, partial [Chloroflexota bacterium]